MKPMLTVTVTLALALVGCGNGDPDGPPTLRLGRDECAECGMMIAEERCAAAILVESEEGLEYRLFDDIGCMLDWERGHAEAPPQARFVRDYDRVAWCEATGAGYLDETTVRTPMASGLLAFTDPSAAERGREAHGGRVLSWDALDAARLAWLDRRDRIVRPVAGE